MSQPAILPHGSAARTRYDDDLYTWAQEQVALLRAGRVDELDLLNVAEELSDVGNQQLSKLESALTIVLLHLLKWDHQPDRRSRSWANSIAEHRDRVSVLLRKNPGLRSRMDEALSDAYRYGRLRAASEIDCDPAMLPSTCPYSWVEVMTRDIIWIATSDRNR